MNLFEFVIKNLSILESIYTDSGEISIPPDQFDYSHPGLLCEESTIQLIFFVDVGGFRLVTKITPKEMANNMKYVRAISDPDVREYVVQAMEGEIMESVMAEAENNEVALSEAQSAKKESDEKLDSLRAALGAIKNHWNIT